MLALWPEETSSSGLQLLCWRCGRKKLQLGSSKLCWRCGRKNFPIGFFKIRELLISERSFTFHHNGHQNLKQNQLHTPYSKAVSNQLPFFSVYNAGPNLTAIFNPPPQSGTLHTASYPRRFCPTPAQAYFKTTSKFLQG